VIARYNLGELSPPPAQFHRAFTGINQQMVDSAPEPWQVFPELLSFIGVQP
jgi:hypothetical protein